MGRLASEPTSSLAVDSYDAQDCISCLYHILQRYPDFLCSQSHGPTAIVDIGQAMLTALQASLKCALIQAKQSPVLMSLISQHLPVAVSILLVAFHKSVFHFTWLLSPKWAIPSPIYPFITQAGWCCLKM